MTFELIHLFYLTSRFDRPCWRICYNQRSKATDLTRYYFEAGAVLRGTFPVPTACCGGDEAAVACGSGGAARSRPVRTYAAFASMLCSQGRTPALALQIQRRGRSLRACFRRRRSAAAARGLAVWVRAGYCFLFSIFYCKNIKIKRCGPVTKTACNKSSCIPAALQEEQAAPPL